MKHYDFFAGISGFGLGATWSGIETVYTCEIDEFCHEWLKYHLPNATHETDIRTCNPQRTSADVAIWTGGFPCQDISVANTSAGKNRLGLDGERSGLWWSWLEAIRRNLPHYIVIENSPNLVNRGGIAVANSLAEIGYVFEWDVIGKRIFGHNDFRKRFIGIAHYNPNANCNGWQKVQRVFDAKHIKRAYKQVKEEAKRRKDLWFEFDGIYSGTHLSETYAEFQRMDAGISVEVATSELKAYGNAICPDVAHFAFELIKQHKYEQL